MFNNPDLVAYIQKNSFWRKGKLQPVEGTARPFEAAIF
jgi:hypothetical protein